MFRHSLFNLTLWNRFGGIATVNCELLKSYISYWEVLVLI